MAMRIERSVAAGLACMLACVLIAPPARGASAEQPEASTKAAPALTPFQRTMRAYRSGPIAETIQIRVKDASGAERRSTVVLRMDAGDEAAGKPRSVRMELGQLELWIHGDRMIVVPKFDLTRYAEFELARGPLRESIAKHVPAILLPELTLGDTAVLDFGDLGLLPTSAMVRWDEPTVDRVTARTVITGEGGDAKFRVLTNRANDRLHSAIVTSESGPLRLLELSVRSMDAGDPASWAISTQGKKKVDSIADLQRSSSTLEVGELYPFNASVLTMAMRNWSGRSEGKPVALVFVKVDIAGLFAQEAEKRDASFNAATRKSAPAVSIVRGLTKGSNNQWIARNVAVIDPAELRMQVTPTLLTLLNPTESSVVTTPPNSPLMTTADALDLEPVFAGRNAAVVVLDKAATVRGIFPVGDRGETDDDASHVEAKVRELLESLK